MRMAPTYPYVFLRLIRLLSPSLVNNVSGSFVQFFSKPPEYNAIHSDRQGLRMEVRGLEPLTYALQRRRSPG
jgi:hypothetical protein